MGYQVSVSNTNDLYIIIYGSIYCYLMFILYYTLTASLQRSKTPQRVSCI